MGTRAYMSFGAGVQSTAIAMLAISRDERLLKVTGGVVPELYIFADTGDEPKALYPHLEMMRDRITASGATFRVVRTPVGDLGAHIERAAMLGFKRAEQLPFFVFDEAKFDEAKFDEAISVKRHCTPFFKVTPLTSYARHYFGIHKGKPYDGSALQCWLGISFEEKHRLKVGKIPKAQWATFFNPLYEMRWHREDCINYLGSLGIKAARSACVYCPFHSMDEWRAIKAVPEDWAKALRIDEALEAAHERGGAFGFKNPLFLNRWGKRLRDLDMAETDDPQHRLWDNECAGVCGV
jgi:hypothetical protein